MKSFFTQSGWPDRPTLINMRVAKAELIVTEAPRFAISWKSVAVGSVRRIALARREPGYKEEIWTSIRRVWGVFLRYR